MTGRYPTRTARRRRGRGLGLAEIPVDDLLAGLRRRAGPAHPPPGEDHAAVGHGQRPVHELLAQHDGDPRPAGLLEALEDRLGDERGQASDISSAMISLGETARARASASICCSPPERLPARCDRRLPSTGNRSMARSMAAARSLALLLGHGHPQVVDHREPGEDPAPLGDVGQAQLADAVRRQPGDVLPVEDDPPGRPAAPDPRRPGPGCSCRRRWRPGRPAPCPAPRRSRRRTAPARMP